MRQLELASTKSVHRRRIQPATPPAALALKDEEVRECRRRRVGGAATGALL